MSTHVSAGFPTKGHIFDSRLEEALTAMREGHPVVLTDYADREDEADLIVAAERITIPIMALIIRECSGIVCLCLTKEHAKRLDLPPMAQHNESRFHTAFTVSIDARHGITTGVSAYDRVATIQAAIAPDAKPEDLVRPGHMFPLCAEPGGVLARPGHTEGAVELAQMAGLKSAAILCELMNPDGTMMRGKEVVTFAERHNFPLISIENLVTAAAELRSLPVAE
jgi:3,4-dihydroxy 2-butanone 4-phosphate synthase